jgi:hypothetical protein
LSSPPEPQRLKPHAIDVRVNVNPVHWFLNGTDDTRSSYYLEDAATEFQVQGLELDWVCVTWDADLRFRSSGWQYHSFLGKRWTNVNKPDRRQYLLNAYRVLLTRARQGMVICLPEGDASDPRATRISTIRRSTTSWTSAYPFSNSRRLILWRLQGVARNCCESRRDTCGPRRQKVPAEHRRADQDCVGGAGRLTRILRSVTTTRHPRQSSTFSVWNTVTTRSNKSLRPGRARRTRSRPT